MNEKILDNCDYQSKLNTYNLSLYARVIEGNYERRPVIAMDCNAKDYMFLYDIGKNLYNTGDISKYEIAVFNDNKYIWSIRPDKYNFQLNPIENDFEKQIYEELIYRENNKPSISELTYDRVHDQLWNDSFKEMMIDLKQKDSKNGDELEKNLYKYISNSSQEKQNNLINYIEEDIDFEI